ncbi:hypothetical protein TYRP_003603 [Tyrophagus putrescentiae]|nr:hypothetical protein TYRP_003603 [Tyrophagus putrescentiae]
MRQLKWASALNQYFTAVGPPLGRFCQIVNSFNLYLKRVYIIYLTSIMYTGSTWINFFSLIVFLSYYIFFIDYLSHIAGKLTTSFMTMLALLMSRYKKIDYYY